MYRQYVALAGRRIQDPPLPQHPQNTPRVASIFSTTFLLWWELHAHVVPYGRVGVGERGQEVKLRQQSLLTFYDTSASTSIRAVVACTNNCILLLISSTDARYCACITLRRHVFRSFIPGFVRRLPQPSLSQSLHRLKARAPS